MLGQFKRTYNERQSVTFSIPFARMAYKIMRESLKEVPGGHYFEIAPYMPQGTALQAAEWVRLLSGSTYGATG